MTRVTKQNVDPAIFIIIEKHYRCWMGAPVTHKHQPRDMLKMENTGVWFRLAALTQAENQISSGEADLIQTPLPPPKVSPNGKKILLVLWSSMMSAECRTLTYMPLGTSCFLACGGSAGSQPSQCSSGSHDRKAGVKGLDRNWLGR